VVQGENWETRKADKENDGNSARDEKVGERLGEQARDENEKNYLNGKDIHNQQTYQVSLVPIASTSSPTKHLETCRNLAECLSESKEPVR